MIILYFNQWFNTIRKHFEYLREDFGDNIKIIGSGKPDNLYKDCCDEFYVEPKFEHMVDQLNWWVNLCKEKNVDYMFDYIHNSYLINNKKRFDEIGTKLFICDNKDLMKKLNNKALTVKLFNEIINKDKIICNIPETIICNTRESFDKSYRYLKDKYGDVCLKYSEDVGGFSYHKIIEDKEMHSLSENYDRRITLSELYKYYENREKGYDKKDVILMPYLDGLEVSVDSLLTSKGFVGAVRSKLGDSRTEQISTSGEMIRVAEEFAIKTGITHPFNIQFRYYKGIPYLLEVNTRLAGGSYMSSMIGIHFISLFLKDDLGMDFELPECVKQEKTINLLKVDDIVIV